MAIASKPVLRGYSHAGGAPLAALATAVLVASTWHDPPKALTMLVYGASMVLLLGMSATYHLFRWRPRVRAVLRRIDHADIFLFIAGSYTAIAFNAFAGWWRIGILASVWTLSTIGIAAVSPALRLPRWALAVLYLAMGWMGIIALPQIVASLGWTALILVLAGGAAYSLGAATYALRRPRLWPGVFGYHELFHLMVLAASGAYFLVMLLYVVPYPRV